MNFEAVLRFLSFEIYLNIIIIAINILNFDWPFKTKCIKYKEKDLIELEQKGVQTQILCELYMYMNKNFFLCLFPSFAR